MTVYIMYLKKREREQMLRACTLLSVMIFIGFRNTIYTNITYCAGQEKKSFDNTHIKTHYNNNNNNKMRNCVHTGII